MRFHFSIIISNFSYLHLFVNVTLSVFFVDATLNFLSFLSDWNSMWIFHFWVFTFFVFSLKQLISQLFSWFLSYSVDFSAIHLTSYRAKFSVFQRSILQLIFQFYFHEAFSWVFCHSAIITDLHSLYQFIWLIGFT